MKTKPGARFFAKGGSLFHGFTLFKKRQLLERIRKEVASYAKVPGVEKGVDAVSKDGRGGQLESLLSSLP